MLNIDWPTEWDPDFRETLRLRLETSLRNVMSKSRNSQLRGNVVVEDVFPGTISPQVRLKHIHSLEPSLIAFSIAVRYEGDAYIALSGLEINLDTTSGTSNRKAAKGKDGSSKIRGDRSGGGGGGGQGSAGGDHNSYGGDNNNNNSTSSRSHAMGSSNNDNSNTNNSGNSNTTNHNDEDGMYSGDANHSLPFYCPFAMRLCNIVIEDTVDVQIITKVVDERPEYYFGRTTTTTDSNTSGGGLSTPPVSSPQAADDSTTSSPSPASSPQQQQQGYAPTTKASTPVSKKTKPVMPLHVLVKSLQYSEHIDATLPEEFAHILQHRNGRKASDDAFAGGGDGEFGSTNIMGGGGGGGSQHQTHSQMSQSAAVRIGEVIMRGDDLSGSTSSSSSANTGTIPLQPLTTETLHKQQLLEKKRSDVINASARSAAESPRMEAVSMARSSIAGGSRTMDVLYGGRSRHAGGGGGLGGRQVVPGGSNLYSVARRGMRGGGPGAVLTPRPSSIVPQRKDSTSKGGGDKSSGSSGSVIDPHLRQTSWSGGGGGTHHTTPNPDHLAPPSMCSGNTLRGRASVGDVPHRLPVAIIRTPRDDEIKAGGALPIQSIIRRGGGHIPIMGGGGGTSSGNSPPHSTSHFSRVLTPISKLGGSKTNINSSSLTGAWPMHRGGWGSSFAFAAGAPQIHAAGKRAEINTRQRDFLATCLEPFSPFYPEGLSFLPPYWNLSAYNHITGAGSALDSVVSQTESQCKSFADLFVFGRFKRVQKGAVSRRELLFGGGGEDDHEQGKSLSSNKGGTTIRLQFFSDPVKSFNVTSNFGSVHTRVNATIESTLRNLVQPAIDKLLIDGIEFTV